MALDPPFCLPKEKVEMSILNNEDVVSTGMSDPSFTFGLGSTFQLFELIAATRKAVGLGNPPLASQYWFTESGIPCKVLRSQGGGWKSGKIRFTVEFIPNEPEVTQSKAPSSPLDDLRSQLNP